MCKKVECGQIIGQLRLDVGHLRFEILKNFIDELPFPFALDPAPFLAVWPQVPLKATPAQEAA